MSEDAGEDPHLDDIWDDPETARIENIMFDMIIAHTTRRISLSLVSFTVAGFCVHYWRRKDLLTLAGLVGAVLQFIKVAIELLWFKEMRSVESCVPMDHTGILLEAHASFLLLLHLCLKARAVLNKIPGYNWGFLQYTTLALLFPPLMISYVMAFTAGHEFYPREGEYHADCLTDVYDGLFITQELLFAVNNVLPCVLFFNGLMTMMTGGTVERSALERAKAVLNIVRRGEKGLNNLPKDQTILRTSIGSLGSYSSHLSIHQPQVEKVTAMRRAFIACTLDLITILCFLVGFLVKDRFVIGIYPDRIGLSWLLTFLAFPMPLAASRWNEALKGRRDLANVDTSIDMNESMAVELSEYYAAST